MHEVVDAVVVGGGHNGLVAANLLADAGWDVVVEGAREPGGAVRTSEVTAPGYLVDLFSAFYPMTAASPVMAGLDLGAHGLAWSHAPTVLAHLRPADPAAVLYRDPEATAAALDADQPGDGDEWLELSHRWNTYGRPAMDALLSPFPPVRAALRVGWRARTELVELARMLVLPVRSLAEERFGGPLPGLLLAGNALHADVTPEAAPSAMLGWLLCGLGQTVGFPVPVGGAARITDALVGRLRAAGGGLRCGAPFERVRVEGGRAVGVDSADGSSLFARKAVIAACDAKILYTELLRPEDLPLAFEVGLRRFHRASSTLKINWAVRAPVPWRDRAAACAGTVHVADSLDELTQSAAELAMGLVPARPFLLVGQMTTADITRSPEGTESMWAYTHVPQRILGDAGGEFGPVDDLTGAELEAVAARMQARIEAHAPGFGALIEATTVQGPDDLESENASLVGGDISGGTCRLHQQVVFRPVPGLARPETPVAGLFLGSASAHPGGSVHGACGANAARAAIWHDRARRARRLCGAALTSR